MDSRFIMFSDIHLTVIILLFGLCSLLFMIRKRIRVSSKKQRLAERIFAISLLVIDIFYHVWLVKVDRWNLSNSLPLELCSLSLLLTIVLLWTGNRKIYPFVFYAGIGGALQAVATPVLDMGYPHFRFFHFFYTHFGIILTALYFTWIKGYRPTFKGILYTMMTLNILLPLIVIVNMAVDGNYMFLQRKPSTGSILDFLGPYPWYLLSLEIIAFLIFIVLWLLFRSYKGVTLSKIKRAS